MLESRNVGTYLVHYAECPIFTLMTTKTILHDKSYWLYGGDMAKILRHLLLESLLYFLISFQSPRLIYHTKIWASVISSSRSLLLYSIPPINRDGMGFAFLNPDLLYLRPKMRINVKRF